MIVLQRQGFNVPDSVDDGGVLIKQFVSASNLNH